MAGSARSGCISAQPLIEEQLLSQCRGFHRIRKTIRGIGSHPRRPRSQPQASQYAARIADFHRENQGMQPTGILKADSQEPFPGHVKSHAFHPERALTRANQLRLHRQSMAMRGHGGIESDAGYRLTSGQVNYPIVELPKVEPACRGTDRHRLLPQGERRK